MIMELEHFPYKERMRSSCFPVWLSGQAEIRQAYKEIGEVYKINIETFPHKLGSSNTQTGFRCTKGKIFRFELSEGQLCFTVHGAPRS